MKQLSAGDSARARAEEAEAAALEASYERIIAAWESDPAHVAPEQIPEDWADTDPDLHSSWDELLDGFADPDHAQPPGWSHAKPDLAGALRSHRFPAHVARHVVNLSRVLACGGAPTEERGPEEDGGAYLRSCLPDEALTYAAEAAVVLGRWSEEQLLTVVQELSLSAGRKLLDERGASSPDELSKTARLRWRAGTKAAVAAELTYLTGKGRQVCHDIVGIALAPTGSTAAGRRALAHGETDLSSVRTWFNECRDLSPEDASSVARAIFRGSMQDDDITGSAGGPDEDSGPGANSEDGHSDADGANDNDDRSDDDGACPGGLARQSDKEFRRALSREVTRARGTTPEAARARRQQARDARYATIRADDDGTACLTVRGPTSAVIGAWDRIDVIARAARAKGDPRTIAQLRVDAATALLNHGIIAAAADPTTRPTPGTTTGTAPGTTTGAAPGTTTGAAPGTDDHPLVDLTTLVQVIAGTGPVQLNVIAPLDALLDPDSTAVGELADHGVFLTAEHLRELALQPGTTLFRIVTDPATGACIDRSTKGYRPDKAMRTLVGAMDVLCRAPGCTTPASRCQLDHEQPYDHDDPAAGGPTSVANLATKDQTHHNDKTNGLATTLMHPRTREVTWRTLFGRIYCTHPHDYTQYSPVAGRPSDAPSDHADGNDSTRDADQADVNDPTRDVDLSDIDLRDRLIYAALTDRAIREDHRLVGWDDWDGADPEDLGYPFDPRIELFHHTTGGAPRRGPDPTHPTTSALLHPDEEPPPDEPPTETDPPPF